MKEWRSWILSDTCPHYSNQPSHLWEMGLLLKADSDPVTQLQVSSGKHRWRRITLTLTGASPLNRSFDSHVEPIRPGPVSAPSVSLQLTCFDSDNYWVLVTLSWMTNRRPDTHLLKRRRERHQILSADVEISHQTGTSCNLTSLRWSYLQLYCVIDRSV